MSARLSPSALFWQLRRVEPERLVHRARRAALVARVRGLAAWHRARIELEIDPSVRIGKDVRIVLAPHTTNVLRIGRGTRVDDRVLVRLTGGHVSVGPDCHLRAGVVLNVAGHLGLAGENILSWGTVVHCAESVHLGPQTIVAEHVTIVDSSHFFTAPNAFVYENARSAPIRIGANSWLCPKATVTSGVRIGSHSIVGSGSTVVRDVPDGHLASGVPATNRRLDLPWDTRSVGNG